MDYNNLFQDSYMRQNIIDFVPIRKEDRVLEINSGCHVISDNLNRKSDKVKTICFEDVQSFLQNCDELYDWIVLIDSFSETVCNNSLSDMINLLECNGQLIIATENKLGLKYWAGCQEPKNGGYFVGIENYRMKNVSNRTYSRKEIESLITNAGGVVSNLMYPYPDHIFTTSIFSDERLPRHGELDNNIRSFEGERYLFFDEGKVFDTIIEEGLFPIYSNSYLYFVRKGN